MRRRGEDILGDEINGGLVLEGQDPGAVGHVDGVGELFLVGFTGW